MCAGGHVYTSRRRARQGCGLPHSPFEGVPAATIFGHRFSFKQEASVGPRATRAAIQAGPPGRNSGGSSSNSGSVNPFSKQATLRLVPLHTVLAAEFNLLFLKTTPCRRG